MKTEWRILPVNFTIKDIGAPLITNLAQGLYAAPSVVREYIQNAVDSYVEYAKVVGEKPSNEVRIDVQSGSLHIFDNGIGMGEDEIHKAKKIAVSDKPFTSPELYVGFRGIGIWAGLAACRRLIIKTSRHDDKFMYRLTIDFEEIAQDAQKPISIKDLLDPHVHLERRLEQSDLHYTHVELQGITPQYEKLIDPEFLRNVIVDTCPTHFEPLFEHGVEIQKFLEDRGVNFYKVFLQGKDVFRDFPKEVNPPDYKELEVDGTLVAVGWASINSSTGKLVENGLERKNISLRVKNFAVGARGIYAENGERWRQLGFENIDSPQNLDWYAGEVHVLDNDIIPNTPRTELEDSHRTRQFIGKLRDFYDELTMNVRVHSEEVNATRDIEEAQKISKKLQTISINDLAQSETYDLLNKVSKILKDLMEDDKLANRKIGKSDGQIKLLHKKIKAALSKKQIREDRAILIAGLGKTVKSINAKLGINPNEPDEGKSETSKHASKKSRAKSSGDSADTKQSTSTSTKDTERLLQAIIEVIENVLGVESEEYAKICSQLEDLFRKKGLI